MMFSFSRSEPGSHQLSPGEKAVLALFVAVLAAATGGMVFFGNAILGLQRDIGHLRTDFVEFRVEVSARLDRVEDRLDRLEARMSGIETVIQTHHGPLLPPAN